MFKKFFLPNQNVEISRSHLALPTTLHIRQSSQKAEDHEMTKR